MGLFPKKSESICPICGNEFGKMSWSRTKENKFICSSCNKAAKIPLSLGGSTGFTVDEIKEWIQQRDANQAELEKFTATYEVGDYLKIDAEKKQWYCAAGKQKKFKTIHAYDEVLGVELIEDGTTVTSGGLGRAAVGGLAFGGVGAIVGGSTGKKKAKNLCTELRVKITMRDPGNPVEYIDFIAGFGAEYKKDGFLYKSLAKQAQECMSLFQIILDENERSAPAVEAAPQNGSAADEIKKFKELLDLGAITQEEFDAKKKQLLGI